MIVYDDGYFVGQEMLLIRQTGGLFGGGDGACVDTALLAISTR